MTSQATQMYNQAAQAVAFEKHKFAQSMQAALAQELAQKSKYASISSEQSGLMHRAMNAAIASAQAQLDTTLAIYKCALAFGKVMSFDDLALKEPFAGATKAAVAVAQALLD